MFDEKQLFKSEVDLEVPTLLTYGDAVCNVEGLKINSSPDSTFLITNTRVLIIRYMYTMLINICSTKSINIYKF